MTFSTQLQRARRRWLRKTQTRFAILGNGSGTVKAGLGKVWVRFPAGVDGNGVTQYGEPTQVNSGLASYLTYEGAGVRVAFDDNDEMTIKSADERDMRTAGYDPQILNSGNPQSQFVRLKNIINFMCRPVGNNTTTSTLFGIQNWLYQDAYGDLSVYAGTPLQADKIDIASYIPAADNHRIAVVFLRLVDESIQIFASVTQAQTTTLDITDYQECIAQSIIDEDVPIQAFVLADGATAIDMRDLGEDMRQFLNTRPPLGFENPVTRNRLLRNGQQMIAYDLTIQSDFTLAGDLVLL